MKTTEAVTIIDLLEEIQEATQSNKWGESLRVSPEIVKSGGQNTCNK